MTDQNFNLVAGEQTAPPKDTSSGPTGDCGYPVGRTDVANSYLVRITSSTMNRNVWALLQDNFTTRVESTWAQPDVGNRISESIRDIIQAGSTLNVTLGSQFMTRRIWRGSTPLSLQLKMKFEAIEDVYKEVVLPCATLQQMALPSKFRGKDASLGENIAGYFLIAPPGPNPFSGSAQKWAYKFLGINSPTKDGDIITIDIGNFMSYRSVIVRQAEVVWGKKFTREGYPTSAVATINFESFEIYTKEDIYKEVLGSKAGISSYRQVKWTEEQIKREGGA